MNGWMQSYSGLGVTPLLLRPEQVSFEDIPHALAQKVRFNGHLSTMGYSVAQHCAVGAEAVELLPSLAGALKATTAVEVAQARAKVKLAFLLHEVSEVYLPDVPAPIKPFLKVHLPDEMRVEGGQGVVLVRPGEVSWSALEDVHARVMFGALGLTSLLPLLECDEVKVMDKRMLVTEKRDLRLHAELHPEVVAQEQRYGRYEPLSTPIDRVWGPQEAKERFTALYQQLRAELTR